MDNSNQPMQPAPAPMGQPAMPQMTPPKKGLSKGALWGIIGGSIGLVVVIVAVILAVVFLGGVSEADYKKARDASQEATTTYNKLMLQSSSLAYGGSGEGKLSDTLAEYKKRAAALKDLKALKDKEVKQAYDAYAKKNEQLLKLFDGVVRAEEPIKNMRSDCSRTRLSMSGVSGEQLEQKYKEAVAPCLASLKKLAEADAGPLSELGKRLLALYEEQGRLVAEMQQAYNNKDRAAYMDAYSRLSRQSSGFSQVNTKLSDIKKDLDKLEIRDELNKLNKVLIQKAIGRDVVGL